MNTKKTAKELIEKYSAYTSGWNYDELARQCALIAVEYLINQEEGYNEENFYKSNWWKDVKFEIENYDTQI